MRSFLLLIHLSFYSPDLSAQNPGAGSNTKTDRKNTISQGSPEHFSYGSANVYIKPGTTVVGLFNVSPENITAKEKQEKKNANPVCRKKKKLRPQSSRKDAVFTPPVSSRYVILESSHTFLNGTSEQYAVTIPNSFLYKLILPCHISYKSHYLFPANEKNFFHRSYEFFDTGGKYSHVMRGPPCIDGQRTAFT